MFIDSILQQTDQEYNIQMQIAEDDVFNKFLEAIVDDLFLPQI
jgi:hypothetical protein